MLPKPRKTARKHLKPTLLPTISQPKPEKSGCCEKCTEFEEEDGTRYCVVCGTENRGWYVLKEEWSGNNYHKKEFNLVHDVLEYNRKILNNLLCYDNMKEKRVYIPINAQLRIFQDIPERFCWNDVYKAFKTHGWEKQWEAFGEISGLFPMLDPSKYELGRPTWDGDEWIMMAAIYSELKYISEEYNWEGTNKFVMWYLLYKTLDLNGKPNLWVPLKITKKILGIYEEKWKDVCDWFGWEYKQIPEYNYVKVNKNGKAYKQKHRILPYIDWPKQEIIKRVKKQITQKFRSEKST